MSSFVPIQYGEEDFIKRIEERTKGEREPIGLLLSGGSARAFAHIGVIKYLEELNIIPDYIISNSMGSIVGILYAAGLNSDQLFEISTNLDVSSLFDITLPVAGGILNNAAFVAFIASYIEDGKQLEDLDIPIMVITEDIATKRQVQLMEGELERVIGASFALPVYFPPVKFRGHMLIDGGVINLAPVDIAFEYGSSVIISSTFYEGKAINLKDALSVLNIALDIGKRRAGATSIDEHPEAVWIRCDVEDFSFMAFDKVEELLIKGYESAKEQSDKLKAFVPAIKEERDVKDTQYFQTLHTSILNNYYLFNDVVTKAFTQQVFVGFKNYAQQKDQKNLLVDESILGLRYRLNIPFFETSLLAGVAWSNRDLTSSFTNIILDASFTPFPFIAVEGEYSLSLDNMWNATSYQRGEIKIREQFSSRAFLFEQFARFEQLTDIAFVPKERLVDIGLSLWYRGLSELPLKVNSRLSYQLGGSFDRHFINTALSGQTFLGKSFVVTAGYHGRYALDGLGDVPFYWSDNYNSVSSTLTQQGRTGPFNNANYLITSMIQLDWRPSKFSPSFSEVLLLKETSVGLFLHTLWYEKNKFTPYLLYGVEVETSISLLGIKELPTSIYLGYDTLGERLTFGFNFGVTTWK